MTSASKNPILQPNFDSRILSLPSPLGSNYGSLRRGVMVWESPIPGYTNSASMRFLYNPSTVTADYYMAPDSSVSASLLFPTAFNSTQLRVPLNQSVTWSLLFDRTYELWGSYNDNGSPKYANSPEGNDPRVVGVLADIIQMQQFTGMLISYSASSSSTGVSSPSNTSYQSLGGYQGILQLIPSWVFFGAFPSFASLWYYGYVSEWDVTVTHWTQFMVPMRCVINITFTMMPQAPTTTSSASNTQWSSKTVKGAPVVTKPGTLAVGPGSR